MQIAAQCLGFGFTVRWEQHMIVYRSESENNRPKMKQFSLNTASVRSIGSDGMEIIRIVIIIIFVLVDLTTSIVK